MLSSIEILNKTCVMLDSVGAEFWICNGTLLGLVRDNKLIPWDNDLDIAVFKDSKRTEIIKALSNAGYELIDDGHGSSYVTFAYFHQKIDINFFELNEDLLESLWQVNKLSGIPGFLTRVLSRIRFAIPRIGFLWELEGYSVPIKYIFPIGQVAIGSYLFKIPQNAESVLEHTYGSGWKTPKQNYNWRVEGANNVKRGKFEKS